MKTFNSILYVVEYPAAEQLTELIGGAGGKQDRIADIRFGSIFAEVIRAVLRRRHDLVIKTAGEGGAHSTLLARSVLAVKPPGFVTPVTVN